MSIYSKLKSVLWRTDVILILSLLSSCFVAYLFLWKRELHTSWLLNTELLGHYGDFVGGFIGGFVSIILLYKTLRLQTEDNKLAFYNSIQQQINEKFFYLLKVYNDTCNSVKEMYDENEISSKEAIHLKYHKMYEDFDENINPNRYRKTVIGDFLTRYYIDRDFFPVYFRILYRIIDVIETSSLKQIDKYQYVNILRSQLSDYELVLIRYNCMSEFGKKMRPYVNNYNILKHLPPLELMEYKIWKNKINSVYIGGVNSLLLDIKYLFIDLSETNTKELMFKEDKGKYTFKVYNYSNNVDGYSAGIKLTIKKNITSDIINRAFGFTYLDYDSIKDLLCFYLMDLVHFSNFYQLNNVRNIKFNKDKNESDDYVNIAVEAINTEDTLIRVNVKHD